MATRFWRRNRVGIWFVAAAMMGAGIGWAALEAQEEVGGQIVAMDGEAPAQEATMGPGEMVTLTYSDSPPTGPQPGLPAAHAAIQAAAHESFRLRGERMIAESPRVAAVAPDSPPTTVGGRAPGSIYYRWRVGLRGGNTSTIAEPAVATAGRYVFVTWNWYAARSADGGVNWSFVNPYADMSDFCCDQDVIYDPGRDIHIWYRQGVVTSAANNNRIRIGVSRNGAASWCFYDVRPTNVNSTWTNQWFDYPRLGLSNDYLYFTTNIFNTGGGFARMMVARWPLDALAACGGFGYGYFTRTDGWTFTPTDNAQDTMYLLDHRAGYLGSWVRVYVWAETSGSYSYKNIDIVNFTFANRNAVCTVFGGANPCLRGDSRILSLTIADRGGDRRLVGTWNAREDPEVFKKPYTEAVEINIDTLTRSGRPLVWNPNFAWFWGYVSANGRGHLGLSVAYYYSRTHPRAYFGISDDFKYAPGWQVRYAAGSTMTWPNNASGDYLRVRKHHGSDIAWVGTGVYKILAGSNTQHVLYGVFSRERDWRGVNRWWRR